MRRSGAPVPQGNPLESGPREPLQPRWDTPEGWRRIINISHHTGRRFAVFDKVRDREQLGLVTADFGSRADQGEAAVDESLAARNIERQPPDEAVIAGDPNRPGRPKGEHSSRELATQLLRDSAETLVVAGRSLFLVEQLCVLERVRCSSHACRSVHFLGGRISGGAERRARGRLRQLHGRSRIPCIDGARR
jgi:hypothetical protein